MQNDAKDLTATRRRRWHRSYGSPLPLCKTRMRKDQNALTLDRQRAAVREALSDLGEDTPLQWTANSNEAARPLWSHYWKALPRQDRPAA